MGYNKDLGTGIVNKIDEYTGLPSDEYGHYLDPTDEQTGEAIADITPGMELLNLTSPYGFLEFAIGSEDDFWCFDWRTVTTRRGEMVIVHAIINSETGGFIEPQYYDILTKDEAIVAIDSLVGDAIGWCTDNDIEISDGWGRSPEQIVEQAKSDLA